MEDYFVLCIGAGFVLGLLAIWLKAFWWDPRQRNKKIQQRLCEAVRNIPGKMHPDCYHHGCRGQGHCFRCVTMAKLDAQ
jgi:hypothetical protein